MALKLTTYNADGSIKTLGFDPLMGFYENSAAHWGPVGRRPVAEARRQVGDRRATPAGHEIMTWQKAFVDKIGYDKLQAFTAGLGQEFSADNAFQTGQVAMNLDGEYRTAFIADQTPGPRLRHRAVPDRSPTTATCYGGGYITGNIGGISKGSKNPELAWALLKYLTTNTDAVVKLANGLKNVADHHGRAHVARPRADDRSSRPSSTSCQNPNSTTTPPSPVGAGYQQSFEDYWQKYQQGDGGDLGRRPDGRRQGDQRLARPGQRSVSDRHRTSAPGGSGPSRSARGCGARSAGVCSPRSAMLAPALLGLGIFFVLPAGRIRLLQLHALQPALATRSGSGCATTSTCSPRTRRCGSRPATRCGSCVILVPVRHASPRWRSRRCWCGRGRHPDSGARVFYLPALVPPVASVVAFVFLFNPGTGPVNTILALLRHPGAAVVQRPRAGQAVAACCSASG